MHVNIWFPGSGRIGHASLELSSGRYISWWPSDNKNSGKKANKLGAGLVTGYGQDTLDDDIESEGGYPTKVIDLDSLNLDEDAIEEWWIGWINGGTYTLLGPNCCKVVYDALRAGGATFSPNVVWSPGILYRYLIRITEGWLSLAASFLNSTLI
ncbi:uncharacterized protein LOC121377519 [Gigantopelta aegis]|uniref:uncharacterized protein LOC121377519 n=1 Tax=Gigantopelta aegis TaxID=1735272 RepID=UPI001B88DC5A|nr:uncharacterized protein LOC121377519 [Gigantopelta aegis]XP_041361475.1 uncharacterized protein LOC121377519 [Gigantopelta aegis]XP_041361476.1 uncharacterized protein LOC121377519 [Gigantopelta aegis]